MSTHNQSLRKLIDVARKAAMPAPPSTDAPAPFGFSTRVAARWAASGGRFSLADAWERLSWWGAVASAALCMVVFVVQSRKAEANPFDVLIDAPAETLETL